MRTLALAGLVSSLSLAALSGCIDNDQVRVQSFAAGPDRSFTYSAATNTVMTANDDGAAERLRRDWLAETMISQGVCSGGYVVYQRRLVVPPQRPAFNAPRNDLVPAAIAGPEASFGNGGDVAYSGSCL